MSVAAPGTAAEAGGVRVEVMGGEPFRSGRPGKSLGDSGLLREPRRVYTASPAPDRLRHAVTTSTRERRANLRERRSTVKWHHRDRLCDSRQT